MYASLLHNDNCCGLISEWSGCGQLGQYCHNKKIIYYFDVYVSLDYEIHFKDYYKYALNGVYDSFDFHKTTNSDIYMYKNFDILYEKIKEVI